MKAFQSAPVAASPVFTSQDDPNHVNLQMQQVTDQDEEFDVQKCFFRCMCFGLSFFAIMIIIAVLSANNII
jgi:hypothetical protein